jgi:hypothetical protein
MIDEDLFRHQPQDASPWPMPDEILMALEDGECDDEDFDLFREMAFFQMAFLIYCFADKVPEDWRAVAKRAWAFLIAAWPAEFFHRPLAEVSSFTLGTGPVSSYPLASLLEHLEPVRGPFLRIAKEWFPDRTHWLRRGACHLYLLARHFQPDLLNSRDLPYEMLAGIFEEIPMPPPGAPESWCPAGISAKEWGILKDRARSRWSARAQGLLVRPLEDVGSQAPALFGMKTSRVRDLYAAAAVGNSNRRGKKLCWRTLNQE